MPIGPVQLVFKLLDLEAQSLDFVGQKAVHRPQLGGVIRGDIKVLQHRRSCSGSQTERESRIAQNHQYPPPVRQRDINPLSRQRHIRGKRRDLVAWCRDRPFNLNRKEVRCLVLARIIRREPRVAKPIVDQVRVHRRAPRDLRDRNARCFGLQAD